MSGIVGGNLGRGSGLVKAGAVDDNSVTLAKMAGLARGKLIYGDASGDPAALAVGGADEVLTHDGTDFDWAAAGGGGIDCDADAWARIAPVTDQNSAAVIDWATSVHMGSNITESGGVITVGTAGWYLVTYHICNQSTFSDTMNMTLRKNDTSVFGRTYWENCTVKYMGVESTVIVECDASDTLDVYGTGYYTGDTVAATAITWFTGVRLGA